MSRLVFLVCLNLNFGLIYQSAAEEFCNWELFQPRCSSNEIIVIEKAAFGRKTMGRCLIAEGVSTENNLEDPKFLGCFADVRIPLESQCSGKQQCDVAVAKIEVETNCHKWLKFHLEIDYTCLSVVQESRHCTVNVATERQHISSSQLLKNGCGSKDQPWIIESLVGQKINISILQHLISKNSKLYFENVAIGRKPSCYSVGIILERSSKKQTSLCSTENNFSFGKSDYYITSSNSAEIVLNKTDDKGYILAFEATGCSDLIPPTDAWLKRTENEATIGCYSTRLRWQLKCIGQRWIGVIGNCSHGPLEMHKVDVAMDKQALEKSENETVVPIVAIAMTGFVISFLIICMGFVFLNRYYAMSKSRMMKQMSTNNYGNNTSKSTYNNGSLLHCTNKLTEDRIMKTQIANDSYFLDGSGFQQDSAHYFELDQALVDKETLPEKP